MQQPPGPVKLASDVYHKLREAQFFLEEMKRVEALLAAGPLIEIPQSAERFKLIQQFHYYFAAMLSSWRCVHYYFKTAWAKEQTQMTWLAERYKEPLLNAFTKLRNLDIHEESFPSNYKVTVAMRPVPSETREFVLQENDLLGLRKLRNKPDLATLLASKPIPVLAEEALIQLRHLVVEATHKGYLP
jgi:hypothetical protein